MDDATPMNLVPSPDQLVSVIETIVSADWPKSNEDHDAYFLRLGLQKKEPQLGFRNRCGVSADPASRADAGGELSSISLGVTDGHWSAFKGELCDFGFYVYDALESDNRDAARAYRLIYDQLLSRYGQPVRSTSSPSDEASSYWRVNGTGIVIICDVWPIPLISLGFTNEARENYQ